LSPRLQSLLAHREKNLLAAAPQGGLESRLSTRLAAIAAKPGKGDQKTAEGANNRQKE
jgi:hypothetical protein